ncbi:NAD kinase [Atopobacter sp. AH10]|uniref:NAD kinase n=1 Tax=Atopobacter sp. AH10 TaxID=2315861 RepID=UPI000EF2488C|nr:NAD kinase [Atopobacter sp. AH10]RLK64202.1 NAD kinase [Atopobacter sp. AH10]
MKITVMTHQTNDKVKAICQKLNELCQEDGFIWDDQMPDVVITIGGDGSMLSAFHRYRDQLDRIRFLGVHTGHLGFYTDYTVDQVDELISDLRQDHGEEVTYPLLEVSLHYEDKQLSPHHFLALNEATIKRITGTFICDVYINRYLFESFRGDGLCVSTPSGSTGVNKSIGGAVLHPSHSAIQLTEYASLNNRVFRTLSSPLVLGIEDQITFKPKNCDRLLVTYDHLAMKANQIEEMTCRVAKERIRFVSYRHMPFWKRVSQAFIGDFSKDLDSE